MQRLLLGTGLIGLILLTACTSTRVTTLPGPTVTQTLTSTRADPEPGVALTTVAPLTPSQAPAKGEVEKACPYIASSQDQSAVSVADIEGDRVYRTTVLTGMSPVGCRFYFWAGPFEAVADITTHRYGSATAATNAMVATAKLGKQAETHRDIIAGVNAIAFQTSFFGPDGPNDWACAFAKGALLVVVRTQQNDVSFNAVQLAMAIAPKI